MKSVWIEFLSFQRADIDKTFISMPSGIVEVQNHSLGAHFESAIAYFFSILTNCSNNAPSNPYMH